MKAFFRIAIALTATMFLVSSCADEDSEDTKAKIERSFDTWMELNINKEGVIKAEKQSNGMYLEWLVKAPTDNPKPVTGDWLMLNYKGMNLEKYDAVGEKGDIFMSRYIDDILRFTTDTAYTHYVPHYIIHSNSNMLMTGQHAALELMRKGDKVRLYIPASLAEDGYSLTTSNGYGGQASQSSGPVIVEMELADVIEDPATREERIVKEYAMNRWGMAEADTIKPNLYMQVLEYEEGDTLRADSTATLYFIGKFAEDDFVFQTNVDSTAARVNRLPFQKDSRYSNYTSYFNSFRGSHDYMDNAFKQAIESDLITYGCRFRMVFTSTYGDGNSYIGYESLGEPYTIIQSYTPLVYEVYVAPKDEEEDDEEEED